MERIEVYKEISSTGKELWEESAKKYTIGIANNLTNAENLNEHIFQDLSTTVKNRMGNCMQEKNERFDDYNKLFNKIIGLYKKGALGETIRSEIYKEIEDIQGECMVTGGKKKSSKKYNN